MQVVQSNSLVVYAALDEAAIAKRYGVLGEEGSKGRSRPAGRAISGLASRPTP